MKLRFVYILALTSVVTCSQRTADRSAPRAYRTNDYVVVGKLLDTVTIPYVVHLKNKNKELVFVGCDHTNDPQHLQFELMARYFRQLQPQIAFNEGGQIPDSVHYPSMPQAVAAQGETGALKYLCDAAGINLYSGDITDSAEFAVTLKRYPKEELFLYYIMERLVIPYLNHAYGDRPFEELYAKAIDRWFVRQHFPLSPAQRTLSYFKQLYKQYMGHPFVLRLTADIEQFDYINPGCRFCAIGRTSKMVRDSILLRKIDHALTQYDRVIVTFGAGHALAVAPALQEIINSKK